MFNVYVYSACIQHNFSLYETCAYDDVVQFKRGTSTKRTRPVTCATKLGIAAYRL